MHASHDQTEQQAQEQSAMQRIGLVALVLGSISSLCTTILIFIAESGNLESMPPVLGFILGGGATTLFFIVLLQTLACMMRKSKQVRLAALGLLLAVIPLVYAALEATDNLPG